MKRIEVIGECRKCGKCCEHYYQKVDTEDVPYLRLRGFNVTEVEGHWYLDLQQRCPELRSDSQCSLHYRGKPDICNKYPLWLNGKCVPDHFPITPTLLDCGYKIITHHKAEQKSQ